MLSVVLRLEGVSAFRSLVWEFGAFEVRPPCALKWVPSEVLNAEKVIDPLGSRWKEGENRKLSGEVNVNNREKIKQTRKSEVENGS